MSRKPLKPSKQKRKDKNRPQPSLLDFPPPNPVPRPLRRPTRQVAALLRPQ